MAEQWDDWQERIQYRLDGLAQQCFLEGTQFKDVEIVDEVRGERRRARRKKYFFRLNLSGPGLVLNVVLKLPSQCTWHLDNFLVERSLDGELFDTLVEEDEKIVLKSEGGGDADAQGAKKPEEGGTKARKKLIEIGRSAKALRLAIWDAESDDSVAAKIFGLNAVGFTRGANPTPSRLKVLLNTAASLAYEKQAHIDRAEVDALCGVALMNARRCRQAAELLARAADEARRATAFYPTIKEELDTWGAHTLLVASYALLECEQQLPEVLHTLVSAVSLSHGITSSELCISGDFVDPKSALLKLQPKLVELLISAIRESGTVTVRLASAKLLEYLIENIYCSIGPDLESIMNCLLTNYKSFFANDSSSSTHRSLETTFSNFIDSTCRLLPMLDHATLLRLCETTFVPIVSDGEFERCGLDENAGDFCHTALAQILRLLFISLNILQGDIGIPERLVMVLFSISRTPTDSHKVPTKLRRSALICWQAVAKALALSANGIEASKFEKYLYLMRELLEALFHFTEKEFKRTDSMRSDSSNGGGPPAVFEIAPGEGEELRLNVTDTKALDRLLRLIVECVTALKPCRSVSDSYGALELKRSIMNTIVDLSKSILLDIAHSEARITLAKVNAGGEIDSETKYKVNLEPALVTLAELWKALWLVIRLLPRTMRAQAEELQPMNEIFEFILTRIRHRSPPEGLLQLLVVTVKGANDELNEVMNKRDGFFMIVLLRVITPWIAEANHMEMFDLVEILIGLVARFLMPQDLLSLLSALATQSSVQAQAKADAVLECVASALVMTTPEDTKGALRALEALSKGSGGPVLSLPKYNDIGPNMAAFYLHVLLSTCFTKFGEVSESTSAKSSLRISASMVDDLVEFSSLTVACMSAAAKTGRREHKEYVSELLGNIFGQCLMMLEHPDSRIRLAGFEIFCASMDILFVVSYNDDTANDGDESDQARYRTTFGQISCKRMSLGDIELEEKGWNFLSDIITTITVSERMADHAIQRACLEFIKESYLGVLLARRQGASALGMKDIEIVWDALCRLSGTSTSRIISVLALWTKCLLINLAFYINLCSRKSSIAQRTRWIELSKFIRKQLFPIILKLMNSGGHEHRHWGLQLAECYLRVRQMNSTEARTPELPEDVWASIEALRKDWKVENAVTAGSLGILSLATEPGARAGDSSGGATLWIPDLPAEVLQLESNLEVMLNKTLDTFLRDHQADINIEIDANLSEADQTEWVPVSDVSALDEQTETVLSPISNGTGPDDDLPAGRDIDNIDLPKEAGALSPGKGLLTKGLATDKLINGDGNAGVNVDEINIDMVASSDATRTSEGGEENDTDGSNTLNTEYGLGESEIDYSVADGTEEDTKDDLLSKKSPSVARGLKPLVIPSHEEAERDGLDTKRRKNSARNLDILKSDGPNSSFVAIDSPLAHERFIERDPNDPGTPIRGKKPSISLTSENS